MLISNCESILEIFLMWKSPSHCQLCGTCLRQRKQISPCLWLLEVIRLNFSSSWSGAHTAWFSCLREKNRDERHPPLDKRAKPCVMYRPMQWGRQPEWRRISIFIMWAKLSKCSLDKLQDYRRDGMAFLFESMDHVRMDQWTSGPRTWD